MSCRIENGRAILPNGKDSKLLEDLRNVAGSNAEAEAIYESVYTNEFKKFYGIDFNQDRNQLASKIANLDENNEPILFVENGEYMFMSTLKEEGTKNQYKTLRFGLANRQSSKLLELHRGKQANIEIQSALINTLVGFINKIKNQVGPNQENNILDDVKNKTLLAVFNKDITLEKAQELYDILTKGENGYDAFISKIKKENINLAPNWDVFVTAYQEWNTTRDSYGNIQNIGTRTLLKESLSNYNLKVKDGQSVIEELDEEFIRIYNISRIQDNPKNKLSSKAKNILSTIKVGTNILGYPETLPLERAYAIVAEAAVGQPNFEAMLSKLDYYSSYKNEVEAITAKLLTLNSGEKAAMFAAFKNTYKRFLLFKQELQEDGTTDNFIINSNQSSVTRRAQQDYKNNSVEYTIANPRAVYNEIDGKLTVKPSKLVNIKKAWNIVKDAQGQQEWTSEQIEALGMYLWELGMNYGPTVESTINNLAKYYELGNEEGVTRGDLFSSFVFEPNKNFVKLLLYIENTPEKNFHQENSVIKKIAELSILFDSKPFGTFISGTNKAYYPINLPTSVDELSELFTDPNQIDELKEYLETLSTDPLFVPSSLIENTKYKSILLRALASNKGNARKNFFNFTLDSYKKGFTNAVDYENQNSKTSLIERMLGFVNRDSNFALSALHIQADRPNLGFMQIPKVSSLNKFGVNISKKEIIEGLIIQDLARIDQANKAIEAARKTEDTSNLIEGYHYKAGSSYYAGNGSAFTMTQIFGLVDTEIDGVKMSSLLENFLNNQDKSDTRLFEKLLDDQVIYVTEMLESFEKDLKQSLTDYNITLQTDVNKDLNSNDKKNQFVTDFIFQDFVGRIEVTKLLRGGYSFAKNSADFYKRSGLLNTPGTKLAIQGFDVNNPAYGMMPEYNALVIKDFDYTDRVKADIFVANLIKNGLDPNTAELYRNTNKSDAQSFISVDMYRGIMQGMGNWNKDLDEAAYQEYLAGGDFNRPTMPLKPYHEQTNVKNGLSTVHMDKNSYTVITPQLAKDFSYLRTMIDAMKNKNIHVVHTESATKGARMNVQDFQNTETLDTSNPMVMDSNKLRFPQMVPTDSKNEVVFNRQIRKNIITNVFQNEMYSYEGKQIPGAMLQEMFGMAIKENIEEDTRKVLKDLGISKVKSTTPFTLEYKLAKLEHLKLLRSRIEKEIAERDLPQNYLDGLDIVPNGPFDYKFKIPLSFPNFSSKFESIVSGIFNKEIYTQKLKGIEAVQIAELGGHDISGELQMYDGQNGGAEVRIKASTLGLTIEELEGKTIADFAGDSRLEFIGYRIPQQGKSSAMVFKVVDFLPENYSKAIMVPGALTIQQGSDFDLDKLHLIFKEKEQFKKLSGKQERNNIIYDVFKSILLDPKHLQEVMTPVSNTTLNQMSKIYTEQTGEVNYNNPLSELVMESRNKVGVAGRGLWSNMLAGRNVAEILKVLSIKDEVAPTINGLLLTEITTREINGTRYTDANISEYLSAAVDAAKSPIQIDINDNKYTIPVAGVMLMVGVNIETVVAFLAQPAIKDFIKKADLNSTTERDLLRNIYISTETSDMTLEALEANSIPKEELLSNFALMYMAGKQLQKVNKIITPGNLDNLNEVSAINSHLDTEAYYLSKESLIRGAKDYIMHQQDTKQPENLVGVAYRGILDTIINNTSDLGFIQNTNAFKSAKTEIKEALGIDILTSEQHKFIDRALNLSIMTQPHSPLMLKRGEKAGLLSRAVIKNMYTPENVNNIVIKSRDIALKYPELNNNPFYRLLREDPTNPETGLARIVLDTGTDLSTSDKNDLSIGLLNMITSPIEEISNYGKLLVANQFLTNGFYPSYGSYIDIIPSEVLTTDILNPGNGSPVEFFEEEVMELTNSNYSGFSNFTHEFVRNYGNRKAGGSYFLPTLRVKAKLGVVQFAPESPKVFNKGVYMQYFRTRNDSIYVYTGDATYQKLSTLGVSNKLTEVGTTNLNDTSVFPANMTAITTERKPNVWGQRETEDFVTEDRDTINKKC